MKTQKSEPTTAVIEFTKESGEVILTESFLFEGSAQEQFDELEKVRSPFRYKDLTLNLSEWPEGRIGSVRLVAIRGGERFVRRELYRKP